MRLVGHHTSLSVKVLGITLDSELKLQEHICKICYMVNKKFNASHMSLDKEKILLKVFIES